ncbi:MAG: universal stress protein [Pseudomonadota bacterium]
MFEKILIATDFSAPADRLVEHAGELLAWGAKEAVLAHFVESPDRLRLAGEMLGHAAEMLREREARLREMGFFQTSSRLDVGLPGRMLHDLCQEINPSLVVLGSHGKGIWKRALLGGTSDAVMRTSRWPLLLVRVALLEGDVPQRLFDTRAVLYPTDFSVNAAAVPRYLKRLPGLERVGLLHVHERSRIEPYLIGRLDEFDRIDRERLDLIRNHLLAGGVKEVEVAMEMGNAARSILDCSERGDYKLVALGLRGRTLLDDVFIGSVAANLARYSKVPLLLVPHTA